MYQHLSGMSEQEAADMELWWRFEEQETIRDLKRQLAGGLIHSVEFAEAIQSRWADFNK